LLNEGNDMTKRRFPENLAEQEPFVTDAEVTEEINILGDGDFEYQSLLSIIKELNSRKEVTGYILKSATKATVDLDDPTKIIDYAMLTSQAFESAEAMASTLSLGEIRTVLIEGKDVKTLCVKLAENKLSIFMQKEANDNQILQEILPQTD
jgi:predicted regulator of Ras-like GTPase activity (Roadblock/LC7/MglB family)